MADVWPGGWKEGRKRNEEKERRRRRRHQPPLTDQRGNWMERRGVDVITEYSRNKQYRLVGLVGNFQWRFPFLIN